MQLRVAVVPQQGADIEEQDRMGRLLRAELAEYDVEQVDVASVGEAPEGAKGLDVVAVTELVVTLSAGGGVLATVVAGVREWLARRADAQKITVSIGGDAITLERVSDEERAALLGAFVKRHSR